MTSGAASTHDASAWRPATLAGTVFEDTDGDGSEDAGEAGRSGVTVFADADDDGTLDAGETTDDDGRLGRLRAQPASRAAHTIRIDLPGGFTCEAPAGCAHAATGTGGLTTGGLDFAIWQGATITGTVFEDTDADGAAREAGEPGIDGAEVYVDTDGDGTRDAGEPTATAASRRHLRLLRPRPRLLHRASRGADRLGVLAARPLLGDDRRHQRRHAGRARLRAHHDRAPTSRSR